MLASSWVRTDWQKKEDYAGLLGVERAGFAWEWLRRNRHYREAATEALGQGHSSGRPAAISEAAAKWGLHAFEQPLLAAPEARPLWRSEWHSLVLQVSVVPATDEREVFLLERLEEFATIVQGQGGNEHLLLSDGYRSVRLDAAEGGLRERGKLIYHLGGFEDLPDHLLTLRRFLSLWERRRFPPSLHPAEKRASRWIAMLRASDALAAGASQREIAARLLDKAAWEPRWRVEAPSVRSGVQRLVRAAERMEAGAFKMLLGRPGPVK